MRTTFLTVFALLAGFGLGWRLHPLAKPASPGEVQPDQILPLALTPTGQTPASGTAPVSASPVADQSFTYRERTKTVRWLHQSGATILINVLAGDAFSPAFGKVLDLSPAELTRLSDVVLSTKRELDASRLTRTTSRISDDGKTLIVEAPAVDLPTSRAAYDRLLEALKSTLGPERYEMFNELGGEGFERSFDQFGLNNVRYELVLQPSFSLGSTVPHFEYKRHYLDATGVGNGWNGSSLSIAQIEKHDPILARFLQTKLSATDGK